MTQHFQDCEKFGLTFQFRPAAVSIPANIADSGDTKTETQFRKIDEMGRMLDSYLQKVLASSCKLLTSVS